MLIRLLDCDAVRTKLGDERRGRLLAAESCALRAHLRHCRACAQLDEDGLLFRRLFQIYLRPTAAPARLRARVRALLHT